jgi:uncharacterized membrane protein
MMALTGRASAVVLLAALVVLVGAIIYLTHYHHVEVAYGRFTGEPEGLRSIREIIGGARQLRGRSIMQLGVLLLVATPIARVVFSAAAFAKQRDWLYVGLTAIVLSLLLFSLVTG